MGKSIPTGYMNCNFAPMKCHENILIFSKSASSYVKDFKNAIIYNPQKEIGKPYKSISGVFTENYDSKYQKESITINYGDRYPRDIIKFSRGNEERFHPTQKPVKLLEYLVKTYTNECDLVLDNCMGIGTTGIACKNLNRRFIGIEKDKKYFEIAKMRIEKVKKINDNESMDDLF